MITQTVQYQPSHRVMVVYYQSFFHVYRIFFIYFEISAIRRTGFWHPLNHHFDNTSY